MQNYKTISEIVKMGIVPHKENWHRVYLDRSEFAKFKKKDKYNVCPEFIKILKGFSRVKSKKISDAEILTEIKQLCVEAENNPLADKIMFLLINK